MLRDKSLRDVSLEFAICTMEIPVGRVRNYYKKINVASIEVTDSLKIGNRIHIKDILQILIRRFPRSRSHTLR